MPTLILTMNGVDQLFELGEVTSIGRHPDNQVQVLDASASKRHCSIEQVDGRFLLRDLSSMNGTFVNDVQVVGTVPLRHLDEVRVGAVRLIFSDLSQQVSAVPRPLLPPVSDAASYDETNMHAGALPRSQPNPYGHNPAFVPSERVSEERRVRADYERLRHFYELVREMSRERSQRRVLERALAGVFMLFDASWGAIYLRNQDGGLTPELVQSKHGSPPDPPATSPNLLAHVVEARVALTQANLRSFADSEIGQKTTSVGIPLLHGEHVAGVLWLESQSSGVAPRDIELLTVLGALLAMALAALRDSQPPPLVDLSPQQTEGAS